jgi:putative ATP-dependent endonuclease of OLD family
MNEMEYRELLKLYPRQDSVHAELKRLKIDSEFFLSKEELSDLDTYAKRIRGEILFARAWLLCEGQCEYLLMRYFAGLMGKPLDNLGVAVIDFQNNGSPGAFVGLARAFEIPWIMLCDNDEEGKKFVKQANDRGLTAAECADFVRPLPGEDVTLEKFLVLNGFKKECLEVLHNRGNQIIKKDGESGFEDEIISAMQNDKTGCINEFIKILRSIGIGKDRVPPFFSKAISDLTLKAEK